MKNTVRIFVLTLLILFLIVPHTSVFAQDPPPPPPGGGHGAGGSQVPGGGAPIGSGMVLLIALAVGYGGKKVYDFKKSE
jgi:hypothetical protein